MAAKDRIIFALDVADTASAVKWAGLIGSKVGFFKVGLELFTATGPDILKSLKGIPIFLDLKFHDIPNTVDGAVRSATRLGIEMMTIHLCGGQTMIRAALDAAKDESSKLGIKKPKIIGVSVLTSLSENDMSEIGFKPVKEELKTLVNLALKSGIDGMVCSAADLSFIKPLVPETFTIITPGIRPAGSQKGDQQRIATPASAIKDGASLLVIGRPISHAEEPLMAVEQIEKEIAAAL